MNLSGVIQFQNKPVSYDRNAGDWVAQEVGQPTLLKMTDELRAAIQADYEHQRDKHTHQSQPCA